MQANYVQRLRLRFRKFGPTRYIGHLDLARTLERAFNRAGLPVAYTQGFNRRPRMQFATALPLGYTSDMEIMDVLMEEVVSPSYALAQLNERMAPGISFFEGEEVPISDDSLQAQTIDARYVATILQPVEKAELKQRVDAVMEADSLVREKWKRTAREGKKAKTFDLRPLIIDLFYLESDDGAPQLVMELFLQPSKTGRPDDVLDALDLDPLQARVHREWLRIEYDLEQDKEAVASE